MQVSRDSQPFPNGGPVWTEFRVHRDRSLGRTVATHTQHTTIPDNEVTALCLTLRTYSLQGEQELRDEAVDARGIGRGRGKERKQDRGRGKEGQTIMSMEEVKG